ncbi:hypothetical protein JHFBIEKO_4059 [Methylobacterium mesophilicum]|nr:hypothetical protein JHFBIEKO_4059 [Methylobacterium mesophilicum]
MAPLTIKACRVTLKSIYTRKWHQIFCMEFAYSSELSGYEIELTYFSGRLLNPTVDLFPQLLNTLVQLSFLPYATGYARIK